MLPSVSAAVVEVASGATVAANFELHRRANVRPSVLDRGQRHICSRVGGVQSCLLWCVRICGRRLTTPFGLLVLSVFYLHFTSL